MGPHGFDWMCGKRGTLVLCSWRRNSEEQLARPWPMPSSSFSCCQLHYVQRTHPQEVSGTDRWKLRALQAELAPFPLPLSLGSL
uniref:Alternative protein KIAA0467 n=1 Tax=Homo sapiens TaxID=9606 RepID=L8E8N5_HUMAN|nr:alternative protein KIAA0467 [Homo sapiens]